MHCSVKTENTTVYRHQGKSAGLMYGTVAGIIAGIASSGTSVFFYVLAAGVGVGAVVDQVDYKDRRDENYQRCLQALPTLKPEPANR